MKNFIFLLFFVMLLQCFLFAQENKSLTDNPPKLTEYVNDETGTLSSDELALLRKKLRSFYDSTSTQILVLMVNSLNGEPVENVTNSIFRLNAIGTKGKNNGALFFISKGDRKIRIEVGYGLEGALTDALSKKIISSDIAPELKNDNYFKGIENGINSIISVVKGEYSTPIVEDFIKKNESGGDFWLVILIMIIPFAAVIIIAIIKIKKMNNYSGSGYYAGRSSDNNTYYSSSSNDTSYSSSSSSDSSSSDTSFSGGGGDSGGGGASGDY